MKILSYSVDNGMIKVITDNPGRPEFVYEADRFNTLAQLEAQINKSIAWEASRKTKTGSKVSALYSSLDAEVSKNAVKP